jgi:hypothetical protein
LFGAKRRAEGRRRIGERYSEARARWRRYWLNQFRQYHLSTSYI